MVVSVPYETFREAMSNWATAHNVESAWNDERLKAFLNLSVNSLQWNIFQESVDMQTEEAANKIRLLAGPHFRTVIKMYEAKKV